MIWNLKLKLFVLIIFILSLANANCQWVDKWDYKELQPSDTALSQLIVPKSDSLFYVIDSNLLYKQIDYNGNIVFKKQINKYLNGFYYNGCSLDGQSLIYVFDTIFFTMLDTMNYRFSAQYYDIKIYNLYNNSIFREYLDSIPPYINGYRYGSFIKYMNFNTILNRFVYFINNSMNSHPPMYLYSGYDGVGRLIDKEFIKYNLSVAYLRNISHDETMNKFILSGINRFERLNNTEPWIVWNYSNFLYVDFINMKNIGKTIDYGYEGGKLFSENPDYRLSNTSSDFIGFQDSLIYFYEIIGDSIRNYEKLKLPYKPKEIVYSTNDKYLIVIANDYSIDIYRIDTKTVVKTYSPPDAKPITDLKISETGKGFFVRNKNVIRLYQLDYLTDVQENDKNQADVFISPNPATDFIEIYGINNTLQGVAAETSIHIYNVFGEIMMNHPSPIFPERSGVRIDVSSLSSGLYFVRVGEKVFKFVKLN